MRMIADTNVLLRAVLDDDLIQSRASRDALISADQIVISRHVLCELVWLLRQRFKMPKRETAEVIHGFLQAGKVIMDDTAVQAGLAAMEVGADFADGVIAYEGTWLGGEEFVSFDKKAVAALTKMGQRARLLS